MPAQRFPESIQIRIATLIPQRIGRDEPADGGVVFAVAEMDQAR
ncbi:hypothetical protein N7E73_15505 [Maridesulfovibrio sp. FT414]